MTQTRLELVKQLIADGIYKSLSDVSRNGMQRCDSYVSIMKDDIGTEPMLALAKHLSEAKQRPDLSAIVLENVMRSI